jgi:hypothetical protein
MAPADTFEIVARRERAEGVVEIVLARPDGGRLPAGRPERTSISCCRTG